MKPVTENNLDVLQNIELRIVDIYRADPSLLDLDVRMHWTPWSGTIAPKKNSADPRRCNCASARKRYSPPFRKCANGGWGEFPYEAATTCQNFVADFRTPRVPEKDPEIGSALVEAGWSPGIPEFREPVRSMRGDAVN